MASLVLYTQPEMRDVDRLVTVDGVVFIYRVSLCKGGVIRAEFNPDTSSVKARIGKKQRPGKPAIRRKD